jgi:hypothetical protein
MSILNDREEWEDWDRRNTERERRRLNDEPHINGVAFPARKTADTSVPMHPAAPPQQVKYMEELYKRLKSEGLSHDKALEVLKEEKEIQALESTGITRSDAQGIVECRKEHESMVTHATAQISYGKLEGDPHTIHVTEYSGPGDERGVDKLVAVPADAWEDAYGSCAADKIESMLGWNCYPTEHDREYVHATFNQQPAPKGSES